MLNQNTEEKAMNKDKVKKAQELFKAIPIGMIQPFVHILEVQNNLNSRMGYTGPSAKRLRDWRDFNDLTEEELDAVIDIILRLGQIQPPSADEIIKLL